MGGHRDHKNSKRTRKKTESDEDGQDENHIETDQELFANFDKWGRLMERENFAQSG